MTTRHGCGSQELPIEKVNQLSRVHRRVLNTITIGELKNTRPMRPGLNAALRSHVSKCLRYLEPSGGMEQ